MEMCSEVKNSKCFIVTNAKERHHIFTVDTEQYRHDINVINGGLIMRILINLSKEEIFTLEKIKEIRDENDLVYCIHELIQNLKDKK